MREAFENLVNEQLPFLLNSRLLLAVSGGLDSMVLWHLCHELHLNIAVAHCNFKLRGADSEEDEQFVLELGNDLGHEVFTQSFDTKAYMQDHKKSLQMAARELRYQWFEELTTQMNFDYVLTAHHADDNLETFLINFTRGTGLNGLTGIPMVNERIVRPLLPFSRKDIKALAQENSWTWREDITNSSRKYLRNKLRLDVIPVLKEINPNLLNSFQGTINHLNETADIVEESLNAVAKRAITHVDEQEVHFKVSEFKKVNNPKAYMHEMFKDFGFTEWNDAVDLLDARSGKYIESNSHRLIKNREILILTHTEEQRYDPLRIEKDQAQLSFPCGTLSFSEVDTFEDVVTENTIFVDQELLNYPLTLRQWRNGDYFYPLGMTGKKKVSKYLKDEKMSITQKERIWVLCSGENIVWVVGKRADDRFRITSNTTSVIEINLK